MCRSLLIIDDEPGIRFALRQYFKTLGHKVTVAQEREEAEALLAVYRYDVVIADLMLGGPLGREGLEVLAFIRERSPGTRVILLTAFGTPEIEREAREWKVDGFIAKPVPLTELAQAVDGTTGGAANGAGPA